MKKILITLTTVTLIWSCDSDSATKEDVDTVQSTEISSKFLNNIDALKDENLVGNPIELFEKEADENATFKSAITKDNLGELLIKAKDYKNCVITVENHTIVKIIDLEDCKQSGSWGQCMPMAEGFVKKGNLVDKKDYINNIIGLPDNQKREMYLFN